MTPFTMVPFTVSTTTAASRNGSAAAAATLALVAKVRGLRTTT